jgi:simple sugar transport system permease protein
MTHTTPNARPSGLPPCAWAAIGLIGLILVSAAIDATRPGGPGLFGPGAFLHLSLRDGVPGGALIDILNYGSAIAILAIGMTPVIATRGIDLSVGSIMAISGAAAAAAITHGSSATAAIAIALGAAALCGLWNGLLVSLVGLQPFVATLILMVAGRGIAQWITGSQIIAFHDPVLEYIGLGRPTWLPLPFPFLLGAALLVTTAALVRRSALGLLIEAVGCNPDAARLAGVRSRTLAAGTYVFSGLCAGIAGLIAAANIKAADPFNAGHNAELGAIFAVVVGGTRLTGGRFTLLGAFIGGLLMQCLITTMYARDISADVAPLPQALVILSVSTLASPRLRDMLKRRRA